LTARPARAELAIVGLLAALYFWLAPVQQISDAHLTVALSERMLKAGSIDLQPLIDATAPPDLPLRADDGTLPFHTVQKGAQTFYAYPLWTAALIAPASALLNALGIHATDPTTGAYRPAGEYAAQQVLAALLAAALIVVLIDLLRRVGLSARRRLCVALVLIVGSSIASSLSRALWAQLPATLLLALLLRHVIVAELSNRPPSPIAIGFGAVMLVLWRQPLIASALALLWLSAVAAPALRQKLLASVACATLLAMALHLWLYGQTLPPSRYGPALFTIEAVPERAWNLLLSASRGWLIYLPLVGVALFGAWRMPLDPIRARWRIAATLAMAGQLALLAFYRPWHGGGAYGPRLLAELTPWCVLLAGLALAAARLSNAIKFSLAALGAWQAFIHTRGAWSPATFEWNNVAPRYLAGGAVFTDWRHPQWLAGVNDRPYPPVAGEPLVVLRGRIDFSRAMSEPFINADIAAASANGRALDGPFPQLKFVLPDPPLGDEKFRLALAAAAPRTLRLWLNDELAVKQTVDGRGELEFGGSLRRMNRRNNSLRIDCAPDCSGIALLGLEQVVR
jgi:hypothetical protein